MMMCGYADSPRYAAVTRQVNIHQDHFGHAMWLKIDSRRSGFVIGQANKVA